MSKRKKKPSERRRQRETAESKAFRQAMADQTHDEKFIQALATFLGVEVVEKLLRLPCTVCGDPNPNHIGFWRMSPEIARKSASPRARLGCVPIGSANHAARKGAKITSG